jgi:hypothetical protein
MLSAKQEAKMPKKDTFYEWCVDERSMMAKMLEMQQSKRWKTGEYADGRLVDQTEKISAGLKLVIADLDRIIASYENPHVSRP